MKNPDRKTDRKSLLNNKGVMKTLKEFKNDLNKINVDRIVRHAHPYITLRKT